MGSRPRVCRRRFGRSQVRGKGGKEGDHIDDLIGMIGSYVLWGLEIFGIIVVVGTMGSWYGIDQLAHTTSACVAAEGGYTTDCNGLVTKWQSLQHAPSLSVETPDGIGVAPISWGQPVEVTVSRTVIWGLVTFKISAQATDISSYIAGTAPQVTYTVPSP